MDAYLEKRDDLKDVIFNRQCFQSFFAVMVGFIISIILGKNIVNAVTVWELADEAGYLSNVAYFLGYDWNDIRAVMPYYGYGYSVFLIPIYLITESGVDLIRGAMCINLLFAIGTYWILIYLLENIGKQRNRILTSLISAITCLNSYLCCNVLKVDCESVSVFWYCLTAVILYKSMKTKKVYWFVILGAASSYLFFIHTRMIVLIVALLFTIFITLWLYGEKRSNLNRICWFMGIFLFCFAGLYFVKYLIMDSAAVLNETDNIKQGNIVNGNYILSRIMMLIMPENLKFYILTLLSKIYYIIISSAGMVLFGCVYLTKSLLSEISIRENMELCSVKLFFLLSMSFMVIVCTLNGAGSLDDYCYFFYSRYYENTVIPVIALGILGAVATEWNHKIYFYFITMEIGIGIAVSTLKNFLYSQNIRIDTARIPGFSWLVENSDDFCSMILWGIVISAGVMGIYFLSNQLKIKSFLVLFTVFVLTWNSTCLGIELINEAHVKANGDTEIAEKILDSDHRDCVYMIDDESYRYSDFYCRMQVLIKDIPLKVIGEDEFEQIEKISSGTWILTYKDTILKETYLSGMEEVMDGEVFKLWKK